MKKKKTGQKQACKFKIKQGGILMVSHDMMTTLATITALLATVCTCCLQPVAAKLHRSTSGSYELWPQICWRQRGRLRSSYWIKPHPSAQNQCYSLRLSVFFFIHNFLIQIIACWLLLSSGCITAVLRVHPCHTRHKKSHLKWDFMTIARQNKTCQKKKQPCISALILAEGFYSQRKSLRFENMLLN